MSKYAIFWLTWLAVGLAFELWTIFNPHENDTLSENVWALMARKPFWGWLIAAFLVWLLVHFLSRGKWA